MTEQEKELFKEARTASLKAYAPYSGYKVGAAILTTNGTIYTGCNIENASYSLTVCAERNAITNAIINGEKEFKSIAIYVDTEPPFTPCGACRQVLSEFASDLKIFYGNDKSVHSTTLKKIFPHSFSIKEMG